MSKLTIQWCKDFKNSVPFFVRMNGKEIGIIKRGEQIQCDVTNSDFELSFIPKAPSFFGWKVLEIKARTLSDGDLFIELSVLYRNKPMMASQLHIDSSQNIFIVSEEHNKKYKKQ